MITRSLFPSVLAFVLVSVGCGNSTVPQPDTQGVSDHEQVSVEYLLDIELPTDVAALLARFGEPDSIERPSEGDPSPWGQWLIWKNQPIGARLRVLADDYDADSTHSDASIRYIEIYSPNPEIKTVYSQVLRGSYIREVDTALPGSKISMIHVRGELDPNDDYHATILYDPYGYHEQDGVQAIASGMTYFFFNEAGILVAVGQSTFIMDGAD